MFIDLMKNLEREKALFEAKRKGIVLNIEEQKELLLISHLKTKYKENEIAVASEIIKDKIDNNLIIMYAKECYRDISTYQIILEDIKKNIDDINFKQYILKKKLEKNKAIESIEFLRLQKEQLVYEEKEKRTTAFWLFIIMFLIDKQASLLFLNNSISGYFFIQELIKFTTLQEEVNEQINNTKKFKGA